MARIVTSGFEVTVGTAASCDVPLSTAGLASLDATSQRTGAGCLKCDSGANSIVQLAVLSGPYATTTYYMRGYFRFANLPGSAVALIAAGSNWSVRLTAGGKLQLWTTVQQGSDSVATIATGSTYYRVEMKMAVNASSQDTDLELRLDGTTVATVSGLTASLAGVTVSMGWPSSTPGTSKVLYLDDVAVNTAAGTVNNSWPGDGQVVMLLPTADSAVGTGWAGGAGAASSLFLAVDNVPPAGVADTGTNTSQIRNATSAASSNYDATMATYTAAGIAAGATVNAVIPWTATAAPVATSAKAGTVGVVSNPAITNIALGAGGTAGAFWSGTIAGTYPTGWKWSPGTVTEAPSVTLGTAPVMRVTQVTASTRIADVCFMGMYVDYTPGAAAAAGIPDVGMALTVT